MRVPFSTRKGRGALPTRALLSSALLASVAWPGPARADAQGPPPNVLLIVVDDLNDWIGVLGGHPQARTPHLDRLAARGLAFTNAHAPAPSCNPSRVSVLAGMRPSTTGIYSNDSDLEGALPGVLFLPEAFRAAGYEAVGVGKIMRGSLPRGEPGRRGWRPRRRRDRESGEARGDGRAGKEPADVPWGPPDPPDAELPDRVFAGVVADYLGEEHDEPFFLAWGLQSPHLPWTVPQESFDLFELDSVELPLVLPDDLEDVPEAGRQLGSVRRPLLEEHPREAVRAYLAAVAFVDAQIGRVLDALDAGPHAGDTIVCLWSDHGLHFGEKGQWSKFTLWEESTRVPLLLAAPGRTQPGSRTSRPVSLLDVYPTLLELCGLPRTGRLARQLDGLSLVPLCDDPDRPWDRPALTTHGPGNHAVRSERWRLIRYADGSLELYDHAVDPHEWHNLASSAEHRSVVEDLAAWLPEEQAPPAPRMPD